MLVQECEVVPPFLFFCGIIQFKCNVKEKILEKLDYKYFYEFSQLNL